MRYLVIVQSIGTAYSGDDVADADESFNTWEAKSIAGICRARNRFVVMLDGLDLVREYKPSAERSEANQDAQGDYASV